MILIVEKLIKKEKVKAPAGAEKGGCPF